ncbi:MAG: Lrp/AsnC family transcriptional regulator, partial [Verrucomicrobiota bacterium]|nr:Lrp/AsnC family transcriptional regulator [Verrucomicrobiota bacterium]
MLPAMDALLKLLRENAALSAGDLAGMLELSEDDVRDKIRQAQADGDILGYQAILSDEANGNAGVQAVIEVKLTPERGG